MHGVITLRYTSAPTAGSVRLQCLLRGTFPRGRSHGPHHAGGRGGAAAAPRVKGSTLAASFFPQDSKVPLGAGRRFFSSATLRGPGGTASRDARAMSLQLLPALVFGAFPLETIFR